MKVPRSTTLGLIVGAAAAAAAVSAASTHKNGKNGTNAKKKRQRSLPSRLLTGTFGLLNRYVEWDRLPKPLAVLNLVAVRETLRDDNLYDTSAPGDPPAGPPEPCVYTQRTMDGTYNDLEHPEMGRAGARFGRNVPLDHAWPEKEPELLSPNPRTISNTVLKREEFKPATSLNLLAAAWIQFQTHDWFQHKVVEADEEDCDLCIELEREDDSWHEKPMRIRRTLPDRDRTPDEEDKPPFYTNYVSHWWDASNIYGSDDEQANKLRSFELGKLKTEKGRLPLDPDRGVSLTGFNDNWWVGLGLLHTLFALEHNVICDHLHNEFPEWSDERLYQTGRLINAALMAKIHTVEWTPGILAHPVLRVAMDANWWGLATEKVYKLFGRISDDEVISGIPGSAPDHHGAFYALTEEFTSVYRLHPLIPDDIEIRDLDTDETLKRLTFPEVAFKNAETVIDDNASVLDVLYSFGTAHPGAITLHNYPRFLQDLTLPDGQRLDLGAVDITRDRERGVPRYNEFRRLLHRPAVRTFEELTDNPEWAAELRALYDNDIERVDTMVGMFAENLPPGFGFSDTAFRVFVLMASRRLKSDRFFTTDFTPRIYTQRGIDWIQKNDMISVLLRHYPELGPALRGVKNGFAPWNRVR